MMVVSEKSHLNLSDYIQCLFTERFEFNKKRIISSEEMRNSGNYNYDNAHSFFGKHFQYKPLYWYNCFCKVHHVYSKLLFFLNYDDELYKYSKKGASLKKDF